MSFETETALLVQRLGKQFIPSKLPADIRRGKPGDCFDWCALQAAKSDGKYQYVEGVASDPDDPTGETFILHAWLTDKLGAGAFDPTWKAVHNKTGKESAPPVIYIGIVIPIRDLAEWLRVTEYKSIIGNRWRNPELANRILDHKNILIRRGTL